MDVMMIVMVVVDAVREFSISYCCFFFNIFKII